MIFKRKHNWLMCWLYVGTFGSFIGFSAGFAMLTKTLFPQVDPTAYAFLGPLVGSLTRRWAVCRTSWAARASRCSPSSA